MLNYSRNNNFLSFEFNNFQYYIESQIFNIKFIPSINKVEIETINFARQNNDNSKLLLDIAKRGFELICVSVDRFSLSGGINMNFKQRTIFLFDFTAFLK